MAAVCSESYCARRHTSPLVIRAAIMLVGSLTFGALVWGSVVADVAALAATAWWLPLIMVPFPAAMLAAYLRDH